MQPAAVRSTTQFQWGGECAQMSHPSWPTSRPTSSRTSLFSVPSVDLRLSSSAAGPSAAAGCPGCCVSVNARDSSSRLLGSFLRSLDNAAVQSSILDS